MTSSAPGDPCLGHRLQPAARRRDSDRVRVIESLISSFKLVITVSRSLGPLHLTYLPYSTSVATVIMPMQAEALSVHNHLLLFPVGGAMVRLPRVQYTSPV